MTMITSERDGQICEVSVSNRSNCSSTSNQGACSSDGVGVSECYATITEPFYRIDGMCSHEKTLPGERGDDV